MKYSLILTPISGYLYLAYFACEITLHRRIIRSLQHEPSAQLASICRGAALARLSTATAFVKALRPEHLQSFWYFGSSYSFALIGSFSGLCLVTSQGRDEIEFYQTKLSEYRWQLRVWSSGLEVLEKASDLLTSAVLPRNPEHVVAPLVVGRSAGDEEKIGETVHVAQHGAADLFARAEREFHDQALRAAADRTRDVEGSRSG